MTGETARMAEAAAVAGLSAEWFRKAFKALIVSEGFPAPFRGGGRRPYVWRREDLETWQAARAAQGLAARPPEAANEDPPPKPPAGRDAQANRRLMSLMRRA